MPCLSPDRASPQSEQIDRTLVGGRAAMPIRQFIQPDAFEPDEIAVMSEVFEAACKELGETGRLEVTREIVAGRIIAAAKRN
jgi:hypothetical protein